MDFERHPNLRPTKGSDTPKHVHAREAALSPHYPLKQEELKNKLERLAGAFAEECRNKEDAGIHAWHVWDSDIDGTPDNPNHSCLTPWINEVMQSQIGPLDSALEWRNGFNGVLEDFLEKHNLPYRMTQHFVKGDVFIGVEKKPH